MLLYTISPLHLLCRVLSGRAVFLLYPPPKRKLIPNLLILLVFILLDLIPHLLPPRPNPKS